MVLCMRSKNMAKMPVHAQDCQKIPTVLKIRLAEFKGYVRN